MTVRKKKSKAKTKRDLFKRIKELESQLVDTKHLLEESEDENANLESDLSELENAVVPPTDGTWPGIQKLLSVALSSGVVGTPEHTWIEDLINSQ